MDDDAIIDLYWARKETAIAETDRKYGAYCHAISYNILKIHEDAEECVNDSYQHAWSAIPPERPQRFKSWLAVVVRNLSLDRYRKNRTKKRYEPCILLLSELEDCVPSGESAERLADTKALAECLNRWLAAQSAEDRKLFLRRYWFGEPVSALAKSKGQSANATAQKLRRLRASLKKFLEKEGVIDP